MSYSKKSPLSDGSYHSDISDRFDNSRMISFQSYNTNSDKGRQHDNDDLDTLLDASGSPRLSTLADRLKRKDKI